MRMQSSLADAGSVRRYTADFAWHNDVRIALVKTNTSRVARKLYEVYDVNNW